MPATGILCRLNLHFRYPGHDVWYMWHHLQQTLPVISFEAWSNDVFDAWNATCAEPFFREKTSDFQGEDMFMTTVFPASDERVDGAFGAYNQGDRAVPGAPGQVAGVVHWKTLLPGRAYRGKSYIGGWAIDRVGASTLPLASWLALRDYGQAMLTAFGPVGTDNAAQLVIMSKQLDNVPRPDPIGTTVIAAVPDFSQHTQRRRAGADT